MKKITQAVAGFDPVIKQSARLKVAVSKTVPADAGAIGIPVGTSANWRQTSRRPGCNAS